MDVRWIWGWIATVWLGVSPLAFSTTFVQTNAFSLGPGETLASDLWLMANQIRLEGDVRDDVFLLATTSSLWDDDTQDGLATLAGEFHNDVWAMGNTVELTGIVQDHARFLARTITLSGSIAGNSLFVGNTIHLTRGADSAGDVWMAGENLIVEGSVEGNLTLIGKTVTLSGHVRQDVDVTAQDFVALPGTEIMGNLTYRCPREFVPDCRVIVHGQVIRDLIPEKPSGIFGDFSLESFVYQTWLFLGALMTGMIFMAVFPAITGRAMQGLRYSLWKCVVTGGMALGLVPLVIVFSVISIIGIPLGLLLLATLGILVYLSKIVVAMALGTWLIRRPDPRGYGQCLLPLIVGLLFIYAGVNSGLAGLVLWLVITMAGLGALILTMFPGQHNTVTVLPPPPTTLGRLKHDSV